MGGDNWASPDLISLAGPAIEGAYFSNTTSLEEPRIQGWIKQHEHEFGGPILRTALLINDALLLVANGITRANSTDGDKIVAAIEQTKDLPVLTSEKFTMDPNTHDPLNIPAYFNKIQNGKFVLVERYAPN